LQAAVAEAVAQENRLEVVKEKIQTQQHQDRQAHSERTVPVTQETVVAVVLVVVEKMEAQADQVQLVTQVDLVASQDQTQCQVAVQQLTEQDPNQEAKIVHFMKQVWQRAESEVPLAVAEKQY
tara:strand:- start:159 stop:527 length:369 start_codon:yes stop_codon:yes gene_type:complete